jgi:P27 family predicted phage terminase small subunit
MGFENSGRRPQPTAVKLARGNPSKTALNLREPKPPPGEIRKPKGLSVLAGEVWDELAPICRYMGTLTRADVKPFARLCELQADLDKACEAKDAPGFGMFTVSQDFDGAPKVGLHAAIKLEKDFSSIIRPYYALFGLDPYSRARLTTGKHEESDSKWAGKLA